MKSAVGYVRVSSDKQVKGESLEIQRIEIEKYCNSKGYELIELYDDKGWSGAKAERPAFQKMMLDARNGKFETVIVYDHSRFARDLTDTLVYVRELRNNGVEFIALRENIETQDEGVKEMVRIIMGATYQHERRKIMERTFAGKEKKRKERRCFIGKQPFGYIWNKEKQKFEIKEAEVKVYDRVVGLYMDSGLSMKDVALKLKDEGILCKKKPFSSMAISYLLKNTVYYGHYVVNRYKYEYNPKTGNYIRTKELKPESEWVNYEIPAIISKQQ